MKLLYFQLILLILIVSPLYGQFGGQQIITSVHIPTDVEMCDLDGDSDLDIILASQSFNNIGWFENDGFGNFGELILISDDANGARAISFADLDNDGDNDLVSGSFSSGRLYVYINDGLGNFEPPLLIDEGSDGLFQTYLADLDNDGDFDLMTASFYDDKVAWYENDGSGIFGGENILSLTADGAQSVHAADLDNDGDLDVLSAATIDDRVWWFENDGTGSFGSPQILAVLAAPISVYAEDMDNDGDLDVLATSETLNDVFWYENDGTGGFPTSHLIDEACLGARSVSTLDMNGDDYPDVIVGADNHLFWYESDSADSFIIHNVSVEFKDVNSVFTGDFDSDGDLDVVSAPSHHGQDVETYLNSGDGVFESQTTIATTAHRPSDVFAVDLDSDGDLDIVSSSFLGDRIVWYKNYGDNHYSHEKVISLLTDGASEILAIDMDDDDDFDIVSISSTDDKIAWYQNDGIGNFGEQIIISIFPAISIIDIDLDNDGKKDLAMASFSEDKIVWYRHEGAGVFGPQQVVGEGRDGASGLFAADIDGDGNADLVSSSINDNIIAWYQNDGLGGFSSENIISDDALGAKSVSAADIDEDGDMDVIFTAEVEDEIGYYLNDGFGFFGEKIILGSGITNIQRVYTHDLDDDDDSDIITFGADALNFVWYRNEGDGVFDGPQINDIAASCVSLFFKDMDGDNLPEVLMAGYYHDVIAMYKNFSIHRTQLRGQCFYDANENGMKDSTEIGINFVNISSEPASDYTFTYGNGEYFMNFSDSIGLYNIAPDDLEYWELVTDPSTYEVLIDSIYFQMDSLDFGFFPDTLINKFTTDLTGGFPRCNDTINYWLSFRNIGTTIPSGVISLDLDNEIEYVSSAVAPDSIVGQKIFWSYDSLFFFNEYSINLSVKMPSVDLLGETLKSKLRITVLDDLLEEIYAVEDSLLQSILCGYDPNDKIAFPEGLDSLGYIPPITESIEYTIRFQNTGNDTAINVVIKDKLDSNLNWHSLEPIGSSHPFSLNIEGSGEVIFNFANIMLPDSNINELASHGFIKYRIELLDDLILGTTISNRAKIYFDLNPPIITNTVLNTIACLDSALISLSDAPDIICTTDDSILILVNRSGGEFIGDGVIENYFHPQLAEIGVNYIVYERDDTLGCNYSDSLQIIVTDCLGVQETNQEIIRVYPNPFEHFTFIYFPFEVNGEFTVSIYDVLGQLVYQFQDFEGSKLKIDKNNLNSGIYILSIQDKERRIMTNFKLVIN